jgi:hypothetical protein
MSGQVWIGSELPEITALKARIAELEAERDNAVRYTELLIQERDASNKLAEECSNEAQCAQADLDSARAGEARAVEALKALTAASLVRNYWFDTCSRTLAPNWEEKANAGLDAMDAAMKLVSQIHDKPALDYLAQQRREAAAEALLGLKDSIRGGTYRPHVAWRCISTRAAALRAGKGVGG